jgi:hypothetical protein
MDGLLCVSGTEAMDSRSCSTFKKISRAYRWLILLTSSKNFTVRRLLLTLLLYTVLEPLPAHLVNRLILVANTRRDRKSAANLANAKKFLCHLTKQSTTGAFL